tara:strand:- start:1624 stop:1806 length:183 start_codon:yes stop_codon:yes gene_type:complete
VIVDDIVYLPDLAFLVAVELDVRFTALFAFKFVVGTLSDFPALPRPFLAVAFFFLSFLSL